VPSAGDLLAEPCKTYGGKVRTDYGALRCDPILSSGLKFETGDRSQITTSSAAGRSFAKRLAGKQCQIVVRLLEDILWRASVPRQVAEQTLILLAPLQNIQDKAGTSTYKAEEQAQIPAASASDPLC